MKMNMCFTKNLLRTFKRIYLERPLLGDCLTYAVLYPMGSFLHQNIDDKNCKHYDYATMMRFSIFGAFYVAPLLHGWIKLTSAMWPHTNFKSGLAKTLVEQVSLSPISSYTFFLGMALLEGKTFQNARKEANEKFLPTFKIASCVWPLLQLFSYSVLPERTRLLFIGFCSVCWTAFLAWVKKKSV